MTLVNFGDWAAQWDELEEAWSVSLQHLTLNTMTINANGDDDDNGGHVDNEC